MAASSSCLAAFSYWVKVASTSRAPRNSPRIAPTAEKSAATRFSGGGPPPPPPPPPALKMWIGASRRLPSLRSMPIEATVSSLSAMVFSICMPMKLATASPTALSMLMPRKVERAAPRFASLLVPM
ncbi:hypothetical protein D9M72_445280 [compost metagenome]